MSPRTSIRLGTVAILLTVLFFRAPSWADAPKGKKVALLVGVKTYEHQKLRDLKYTENDVEEMAALLRKAGYDGIVLLTTTKGAKDAKAKPTAANIRKELNRLRKQTKKHDVLLVALAGHGVQYTVKVGDKEKDESFFCPADAQPRDTKDLKELSETLLPLGELFKELDDSGAGSRLLLVDACRNDARTLRNLDSDNLPRPARGTAALFACKGGEFAHETNKFGKGHGVFFHFVLEGLRGKAKNEDGEVTWLRLADYVTRQVQRQVPTVIGEGAQQTPHSMGNVEGNPVLVLLDTKLPDEGKKTPGKEELGKLTPKGKVVTTDSGLQYEDLKVGEGAPVKKGDTVEVHYTGWLKDDGKKFDSSLDRKEAFEFKVGEGKVIKGWDEGLVGMKPGGKRKLIIPSKLGYGPRGAGKVIPPDADLVFDVELIKIK